MPYNVRNRCHGNSRHVYNIRQIVLKFHILDICDLRYAGIKFDHNRTTSDNFGKYDHDVKNVDLQRLERS